MAEKYIVNDLEVLGDPITPRTTTIYQSCFKKQKDEA